MCALPAPSIYYAPPSIDDLDRIEELEAAGYPVDEAASRERLAYRIEHASGLFLCAIRGGSSAAGTGGSNGGSGDRLIGFCCGTAAPAGPLTEESMGQHDPEGTTLCLHSVCVDAAERRNGVASSLLRAYLAFAQATHPGLAQARLLCKPPLVPLYEGAGFELVGPSPVQHGSERWLEMARQLGEEEGDGGEEEGPDAAEQQQQQQQPEENGAA